MKRRISEAEGLPLIQRYCEGDALSPAQLRTAVRFALEEFSERYPGKSVEIRIPWIGATQAIAGINHRRGTPPNVVEMDGQTWLALTTGVATLPLQPTAITYSGTRADLSPYLPIF